MADEGGEVAASEYHRAKADVAALEQREERLSERIEQLRAEREEVVGELEAARERVNEAEEQLVDPDGESSSDGDDEELERVARELLVDVAEGEIGTNGLTDGSESVGDAALRAKADRSEVIEEMRRQAAPVADEMEMTDSPVERSFLVAEDDMQDRVSERKFDEVRRAVADVVLDEGEYDTDDVPSSVMDDFDL